MKWLQTITKLPILVKGVLTAEDGNFVALEKNPKIEHFPRKCQFFKFLMFFFCLLARLAVHAGAAGIIVSNHGARQLDYVPATINALEEVRLHIL